MVCDSVDALLFDLGNVVVEIDFNRAVAHWAAHARCEESLIRERFRHDHAYDQYERGKSISTRISQRCGQTSVSTSLTRICATAGMPY